MSNARQLDENQIKAIKALMKAGLIRDFDDLFAHLTTSQVAGMLGTKAKRVTRLKADRTKLYLQDIFKLAEQLQISHLEIYALVVPEEEKPKPKKRSKK